MTNQKKKQKETRNYLNTENLDENGKKLYASVFEEFNDHSILELREMAKKMGVKSSTTFDKEELVRQMTAYRVSNATYVPDRQSAVSPVSYQEVEELVADYRLKTIIMNPGDCQGILQIRDDGAWLLNGFISDKDTDVFVPMLMVNECKLRPGDFLTGKARLLPKASRQGMFKLETINGEKAETYERREYPNAEPVKEIVEVTGNNAVKAVAALSPFALGQRRLIIGLNALNLDNIGAQISMSLFRAGVETINLFLDHSPENIDMAGELKGKSLVLTCEKSGEYDEAVTLATAYAKNLAMMGKHTAIVLSSGDILKEETLRMVFGAGRNFGKGSLTVVVLSSTLDLTMIINRLARTASAVTVLKNNFAAEPFIDLTQTFSDAEQLLPQQPRSTLKDLRNQIKDRYISVKDFMAAYNVLMIQNADTAN